MEGGKVALQDTSQLVRSRVGLLGGALVRKEEEGSPLELEEQDTQKP